MRTDPEVGLHPFGCKLVATMAKGLMETMDRTVLREPR
jgi:hypothetical protein